VIGLADVDNAVVPNLPCGVERGGRSFGSFVEGVVPNLPCGVERAFSN